MQKQVMDLARMRPGEFGTIVEILGGHDVSKRLETLGIRPHVRLKKISGQLARGPITVQVNNTRAAIGFGMAAKIIVELDVG